MKDSEFVEKYRGGTIHITHAGKHSFYTWTIYHGGEGPYRRQRAITSRRLNELKSAADAVIEAKGESNERY